MYTVGNNNFGNGVRVWRFNEATQSFGCKFCYVFSDGTQPYTGTALGIWGSGPNDIYVIGVIKDPPQPGASGPTDGRLYHFDGTSWQQVMEIGPIPVPGGIWGTGPEDIWVTLSNGQLLHYAPPASNQPPVADNDTYNTNEDTDLSEPVPGVLNGDTDVESDLLTAVLDTTTSNGTLTLNSNGSFTYTPNPNFCGQDSFTYHANDGAADSNIATVTIDMLCVNDPPVVTANQPVVTVEEGQAATNSGTMSDVDGDLVTLNASVGTVVGNGNGTWSWNFTTSDGPAESQTVTIFADDSKGGISQTTFELEVNNVVPTVNAGPDVSINRGVTFTGSGSFTDPGADNWTATVDYGDGSGVQPLVLNPDKTFLLSHTYTNDDSYTVMVTVTDDDGGTESDTLVVQVLNRLPDCAAAAPSVSSLWPPNHQFVPVNVLGVTDPENDPISITINTIRQDELTNTEGDGTKKEPGNGRVYHIGFTAADGHGGTCAGEVLVGVPHDQGSTPIDDGAFYDSTVP
ncbi:MAG: cadherin-like domain-containing protein [Chloroflexi bacterium]|nr:cadherin-like domain-containing protein [Chloroflexota bacterium]